MLENNNGLVSFSFRFLPYLMAIAAMVLAHIYLDWGFWQIIGAMFLMTAGSVADDNGPKWRRWLWVLLIGGVLVLGHFYLDERVIKWGLALLALFLLVLLLVLIGGIYGYQTGDGSTITAYVLGLIVLVPITGVVIYKTLMAFGYL